VSSLVTSVAGGKEVTNAVFASIAMSILASSFSVQMLAYDADVSPAARRFNPLVHGLVPDANGWVVLVTMVAASACTLASQLVNYSLLLAISGEAALLYWLVPLLAYLARKRLRKGDWRAFSMPDYAMVVVHIVFKTIVDFTFLLTGHWPGSMGGVGFLANLAFNQFATLVVAGAYVAGTGGEGGVNGTVVWIVVVGTVARGAPKQLNSTQLCCAGINCALALSFGSFLLNINSSHVMIFLSFSCRTDEVKRLFHYHTEPELRLYVTIGREPEEHWADFREEIKAIVQEHVEEWEKEKPLWWNARLIARIPIDMLEGAHAAKTMRRKRTLSLRGKHGTGSGFTGKGVGEGLRRSVMGSVFVGDDDDDDDDDVELVEDGGRGGGGKIAPEQ
jgi:hypothetical protein